MLLRILASATTWAAVGALATLLTALITLILGLVFSGRQTVYARRSAENARVSASAAVSAIRLAEKNLELVSEQMKIVRDQTDALERQVNLGMRALTSQDRPAFHPGPLRFSTEFGIYTVELKNVGRGTGWLTKAQLVAGPDRGDFQEAIEAVANEATFNAALHTTVQLTGVGQTCTLSTGRSSAAPPEPTILWLVVTTRDTMGTEAWTHFFAYRSTHAAAFSFEPGKRATAVFACRGVLIADNGGVTWPLAEVARRTDGIAPSDF